MRNLNTTSGKEVPLQIVKNWEDSGKNPFGYQSQLSYKADTAISIVVYPEGVRIAGNGTWDAGGVLHSSDNLQYWSTEHLRGRACRTTTIDPPTMLVHSEELPTFKEAYRREHQVKRRSRAKKEALICGDLEKLKRLARRQR